MMTYRPTSLEKRWSGTRHPMSRLAKLSAAGTAAILLSLVVLLYVRQLTVQLQIPSGVPKQPSPPQCEPIELSGILRRPSKSMPTLDLVPAGALRSFKIAGSVVDHVPAGTPIRVQGVVRSSLHTGGTKERPSAFPAQWNVYLLVTELEILDDPMIMLKRKTGQE